MAKKNKGWDYLNSDDINSMSDGSKDDWGYIDSDGSGSFHGGDGSWGYKNPDGSGSYYGSDGSWGYKNTDGSGSFHDADGSWGYRNSDGSVSYHGSDGSWGYKNADGSGSFYGGTGDSDSLEGLKYTEAVQRLKESGFSNVHTKEISDLTISKDDEENLVTEIRLIFGDSFAEDKKYPSNLWITVVYHTVELYASPLTSKEAKGMNYLDVIDGFEKAGFVNVTTDVKYDIVTGWLTDDGEVKSVSINGDKKFDSDDEYRLDAEVVITYHTWKKNRFK